MINLRSLPLCMLASVFLYPVSSLAQQVAPAARILNPVDESNLVTLTHTVNPLANAANDRGAAPDGMMLDRLQLVLERGPAQEAALHQLLAQQNTPGSPSYHQWLTPTQFGAQFGTADQDISTVETWLGNHGFSITKVNPGKGTLEFSGSVAQLRDAFHTQIHKYAVNGETHYANATDPQIPAALAPVIAGFSSLNNFRPKPYIHKLGEASFNPTTRQVTPSWTQASGAGVYYVLAPGDFAVQYDLNPLYAQGINGSGQTIAIINDSNINIDLVNQFRSLFSLSANPPQVIIDGNDPGVDGINNPDGPNYDSTEAYLDVEWAGTVAPNATIDLVVAADTPIEEGLILAAEHAVYSNIAPVVSISFGSCESGLGSTNAFLSGLWEQAAAQGQTVMVSSGDSGSAGCDDSDTQEYAVSGQAVNGFASTAYNVAVGGTDFYYTDYATGAASVATYWNSSATQLPAVSLQKYIPEQPWNDSQFGLNAFNQYALEETTSISGGGGGASNAAICSSTYNPTTGVCGGTLSGYPKPSWQTGTGVPSDGVRDLPDVSLFSANGSNYSFYPICATDGDCQSPTSGNQVQIYGVGGTSASAPAFAGIMALVNQRYGPQGQADTVLYPLAMQFPASFHDVAVGSNSVPCEYAPTVSTNCISVTSPITLASAGVTEGQIGTGTTPEYNAGAGYDEASGLGTIDANQLVSNWAKVKLATTTTTMTPSSTSFAHGTAVTISGAVTSGSGTPSGDVALMTDSTEPNEQGQTFFTLSGGSYTGSTTSLPGGTYHIWAQYGGDYTNGFSTSAKTQITVTPETPGMNFNIFSPYSSTGYYNSSSNPGTSVDYGTQLSLSAEVAPVSDLPALQNCVITNTGCSSLKYTQPTGTVTFADSSTTIDTAVVNAEGDAEYNAPFAVGTHSVVATYNGDQSYGKYTSTAIPFTVIKDTPNLVPYASASTSSQQVINGPNQPLVITIAVLNGAQSNVATSTNVFPVPVLPPTGTVTATGFPSGVNTSAPLVAAVDPFIQGGTQAVQGVANFTVPAGTTSGNYNVTFCYSGDSNYFGLSGSNCPIYSIPIVNTNGDGYKNSVTTATMSGSLSPNSTITVTGTVTGVSGSGAPGSPVATNPGYILVYSSGYYVAEVLVTPGSGVVSNFSFPLSSQTLLQGSNLITLQYTGDSVYNPSAYTLNGGAAISSPLSDFSLVPNSTIVPVTAGSNGTDTINATSVNGFTGAVSLTCAATAPVTCAVTPNPTLTSDGTSTSTLTVTAPSGTVNGNYDVLITGKDPTNEFVHTLSITAAVSGTTSGTAGFTIANSGNITLAGGATTGNTSTIAVTPTNGFTGPVNLSCAVTTAPTGATNPVTCSIPSSLEVTGVGAVSVNVTANSVAATTPGTYVIQVTATSGSISESTNVSVAVSVPSFTLSSNQNISVVQGVNSGNTSTISVTPTNGFTGTVGLTCAVTPTSGTSIPTCALSPTSVAAGGTSTLTVTTTGTTTTGAYVVTVTGTSGSIVETTQVNVQVNAAASTFMMSNGGNITVSPGATTNNTSTISVTPGASGFSGTVTLTCAITPAASSDPATCSFASPSVTLSGTTAQTDVLTVSTTAASADLVYPKLGNGNGWLGAGGGAILALLVFFGIPARRRSWRSMLSILVAMVALGVLSSCGGGSSSSGGGGSTPSNPGTSQGTYTVTVTGAATGITPSPTTAVTLTVN